MQSSLCSGRSDAPHAVPFFGRKRQKTWSLAGRVLQSIDAQMGQAVAQLVEIFLGKDFRLREIRTAGHAAILAWANK